METYVTTEKVRVSSSMLHPAAMMQAAMTISPTPTKLLAMMSMMLGRLQTVTPG
jgi:hypothetical protein